MEQPMDTDESMPQEGDSLDVMVQKLMQLSFTHGVAYKIFAEAQEGVQAAATKAFTAYAQFQEMTTPPDKKETN